MRIFGRRFRIERTLKPLPAEVVTALSQMGEVIDSVNAAMSSLGEWQKAIEQNVKETRQRLETVYRKVYRDRAKENGGDEAEAGAELAVPNVITGVIRPGDPFV